MTSYKTDPVVIGALVGLFIGLGMVVFAVARLPAPLDKNEMKCELMGGVYLPEQKLCLNVQGVKML